MNHQKWFHMSTMVVFVLLVTSACASPLGSISGTILLESDDPFLWIYAHEVNSGKVHSINPQAGARTYTLPDLPAGTYVVVGWFEPLGASGAYTSLDTVIAEGVDQMRASEETIVEIKLEPGEEYAGADIGCWEATSLIGLSRLHTTTKGFRHETRRE